MLLRAKTPLRTPLPVDAAGHWWSAAPTHENFNRTIIVPRAAVCPEGAGEGAFSFQRHEGAAGGAA